eukprot:7319543-Pyramimonas_sp.AAC.1
MATWSRLGAVLVLLGASWKPSGASKAVLSHIGGYLALSDALLEPYLDASTPREPPPPGPGEGVGVGGG